jgi:biopolymer transport protein ExbB
MQAIGEYISQGGVFMYPILVFSVWGITLIIERAIYYYQAASRTTRLRKEFFRRLEQEGKAEARDYLEGQSGVLKNVLLTALEHADQPQTKIEKKVDARLLEELPLLGKYLNTAATLGALMPILGLLGTVTGMIATFKVIALQGTGDAQALADGISEALITTQSGLVAAVPIILGHNFLTNRYQRIVAVVKECIVKVLDYIEEHKDK